VFELQDGQVDGGRCNQRTRLCAVSATPCHKIPHVVVGDFGDELVLAEKLDHEVEPLPCVAAASVMLTVRFPEPASDIIEPYRRECGLDLNSSLFRLLALA